MINYARKEAGLVALFAACQSLALFIFVHNGWLAYFNSARPTPNSLYAPEAYRIAIGVLYRMAHTVVHHLELSFFYAALDVICSFAVVILLYRVAVRGLPPFSLNSLSGCVRPIVAILFLAFTHFPIIWIVPWQRPETTPSALYLAIALTCLTQSSHRAKWLLLAAAATLAQSFMRADLPFIFGVAVMIVSFLPQSKSVRRYGLACGAAMAGIAAATQLYLQTVLFPHLSYPPDTAIVQLRTNLSAHMLFDGFVALLPCLLLLIFLVRVRPRITPLDMAVLLGAALYFCVWFTVGVLQEVRIFVPMIFALAMTASRILGFWLAGENQPEAGPAVQTGA